MIWTMKLYASQPAKLNAGGRIKVRLDNVDLEDVAPTDPDASETGFRGKERGPEVTEIVDRG